MGDDPGLLAVINEKPEFNLPPQEKKYSVLYGEAWHLDLGEVYDAEGDNVTVEFNCTSGDYKFLKLNADEAGFYFLSIRAGNTTESDVGAYNFEIALTDLAQSTVYEFRISIETPEQ